MLVQRLRHPHQNLQLITLKGTKKGRLRNQTKPALRTLCSKFPKETCHFNQNVGGTGETIGILHH